jgi:phosphatidylglycerophosphatase C
VRRNLAIFDFDGTITKKDSFLELIKFHKGTFAFYIGAIILLPVLVAYKIKLIKNWRAKEIVLSFFFRNSSLEEFQKKCDDFAGQVIPKLVRPKAYEKILAHQSNGDRVIVVSASAENWLRCWCDRLNIELIGTQLEVKNEQITGKLCGQNCYGPEKLKRVLTLLKIEDYKEIYVYGDSRGDKEILEIATQQFYRYF